MNRDPRDSPIDLPLRGPGGRPHPERGRGRRFDSGPDWSGERHLGKPPPTRRSWRPLLWILLLLLLAGGGFGAYFVLRPPPPRPSYDTTGLDLGELRVGGAGDPATVTITNLGEGEPMRLSAVGTAGEHPDDFEVVGDSCIGFEQAPGESCEVQIRFTPREMGIRSAALELSGNLPWRVPSLPLAGVGIAPRVVLEPPAVDFGAREVTEVSESTLVRFVNAGTDTLTVREIALAGDHPSDFVLEDRCAGRTFGPEERCAFRLAFQPRAAGPRAAEVRIESDVPGGAPSAALSGSGLWSGPAFTPDPASLDFGDQRIGRESKPRSLEVINRTAAALPAPALVEPSSGTGFRAARSNCSGATVAPGESCRVELVFAPTTEGRAEGEITVRLDPTPIHVDLTGRGVAPALTLGSTALDFGDLRIGLRGAPQRLELTNSGNAELTLGAMALRGEDAGAFEIVTDRCSKARLAPSRSCSMEVDFGPTAEGELEARLTVPSDAAPEPEIVTLSGRGTRSFLSVLPSEVAFGDVVRGEPRTAELQMSNRGTARLTVQGLTMEGSAAEDYHIESIGCRLDEGLPPGGSCTLGLQFRPTAEGARPATLVVRHDGAEGRREVALRGVGMPPLPAFALAPSAIDFGESAAGSRSAIRTVTISNLGKGFLELREVSLSGPDAQAFQIVAGTCEGAPRIAPGSECTVGVRFFPQRPGSARAELTVRHNAPESRGQLELRGEGT